MSRKEAIDWDAMGRQFRAACGKEGPGKAAQRAAGKLGGRGNKLYKVTPEGVALAELVRRRRCEMGLTQAALATRLRAQREAIGRLEKGEMTRAHPVAVAALGSLGLDAGEGRAA